MQAHVRICDTLIFSRKLASTNLHIRQLPNYFARVTHTHSCICKFPHTHAHVPAPACTRMRMHMQLQMQRHLQRSTECEGRS